MKPFDDARVAVKDLECDDRCVYGIGKDAYEEIRLTGVNARDFRLHPAMFYDENEKLGVTMETNTENVTPKNVSKEFVDKVRKGWTEDGFKKIRKETFDEFEKGYKPQE